MRQITQEDSDKVARLVAEAARLPLSDAAFALWRERYRLDEWEGRMPPSSEQVESEFLRGACLVDGELVGALDVDAVLSSVAGR